MALTLARKLIVLVLALAIVRDFKQNPKFQTDFAEALAELNAVKAAAKN